MGKKEEKEKKKTTRVTAEGRSLKLLAKNDCKSIENSLLGRYGSASNSQGSSSVDLFFPISPFSDSKPWKKKTTTRDHPHIDAMLVDKFGLLGEFGDRSTTHCGWLLS